MDIDMKKADLTEEEKQEIKKPKNLIEDLLIRMNEVVQMKMNPSSIEILQSKSEKLSYHIIFGELRVRNCREAKQLCEYFIEQMAKHPILSKKGVIDDKIERYFARKHVIF